MCPLLQVNQYDTYLRGYQAAAIQTERLAALLNAGQSVILAAGAHRMQLGGRALPLSGMLTAADGATATCVRA